MISLNRRKRLAQIARNVTNQYLQRLTVIRRYPTLICFFFESLVDTNDKVLKMFDDYWEHIVNGSKKELDKYQLAVYKSQNQAIQTLSKTVGMVINEKINDQKLRSQIYKIYPKEILQEAVFIAGATLRPIRHTFLYYLKNYYSNLKHFTPNFLNNIDFRIAHSKDNFSKALEILTEMHAGKIKKLPVDSPVDFISPSWKKIVFENEAEELELLPQRQQYELCVLSSLRDRIRSGDVFIDISRKYADFNSLLLSDSQWNAIREDFCKQVSLPSIPTERIDKRIEELGLLLEPINELLKEGGEIRLEEGVLVVPALTAEDIPESAKKLREQINQRLPKVNITEIIREVDT